MYDPSTSSDTDSTISSPELADGLTPCNWPVGPKTSPCGPDHAHVNLSARQAVTAGWMTRDTYGPRGDGSSTSADLQSFLASKLQARLAGRGFPAYRMTWKQWGIAPQPPICALRASAPRTSGKDSGSSVAGWGTPNARDHFPAHSPEYIAEKKAQGHGMANLNDQAQLAGWPTPNTLDVVDRKQIRPSRVATNRKSGYLTEDVLNLKDNPKGVRITADGKMLTGSDAAMGSSGQLNPAHSRWLMGYPPAWDDCAVTAMPSSRKSRRSSSKVPETHYAPHIEEISG